MNNYLLRIGFDGSSFHGWQYQKTQERSVEGVLLKAWAKLAKGEQAKLIGSGRTDKGVHALEQAANLLTAFDLPVNAVKKALNALLPDDILIHSVTSVPLDFHARYDARLRTYLYKISKKYSLFDRFYSYYHPFPLDLERMRQAASCLLGEHDFSSFRGSGCFSPTAVRKVSQLSIEEDETGISLEISANAFLYRMVRCIMGTLIAVGDGRINSEQVKKIMDGKDRSLAPKTAPAHGLYLKKIIYDLGTPES